MREEMVNRIAEAIRAKMGEACRVSFRKVRKNNGLTLQAVEILEPGMLVCPSIYLNHLLDRITSGEISVNEAVQEIIEIYKENKDNPKCYDMLCWMDKSVILEKVVYQLINEEKNREQLCDMPYQKFLDLAVVYRVIVGENPYGTASFMVTNAICEKYDISKAELNLAARQNTEKKGFKVQTIASIIAEITGVPEGVGEVEVPMWVFSNTQRFNGAAVMLYGGYFGRLAESMKSDLYVLPSSIHEVIAVPVDGMDSYELKAMVGEVNSCEVTVDEVLSENVYRYSRKDNKISIA